MKVHEVDEDPAVATARRLQTLERRLFGTQVVLAMVAVAACFGLLWVTRAPKQLTLADDAGRVTIDPSKIAIEHEASGKLTERVELTAFTVSAQMRSRTGDHVQDEAGAIKEVVTEMGTTLASTGLSMKDEDGKTSLFYPGLHY